MKKVDGRLLERLLQSVGNTAGTVVGQAGNNLLPPGGLLGSTVDTLRQTLQRTVDRTGSIVERTLDAAGACPTRASTVGRRARPRDINRPGI